MSDPRKGRHIKLWSPATYRIEVEGVIDETCSDRLGGMHITRRLRNDQSSLSTLIGELSDQGELNGVLTNLYELHLPILSVEYIAAEPSDDK